MEPALPLFWSAPLLLFPCLMICSSSTTSSLLSAQLFFISLCSSCPWDGLFLSFSPSHLSILGRSPRRQSRFKSIKLSQRPFSYLSLWESLTLLASHSQRFEFDPLHLPCLPPCPLTGCLPLRVDPSLPLHPPWRSDDLLHHLHQLHCLSSPYTHLQPHLVPLHPLPLCAVEELLQLPSLLHPLHHPPHSCSHDPGDHAHLERAVGGRPPQQCHHLGVLFPRWTHLQSSGCQYADSRFRWESGFGRVDREEG
jgi:hypothetical protein